jgi:hypothetical protein
MILVELMFGVMLAAFVLVAVPLLLLMAGVADGLAGGFGPLAGLSPHHGGRGPAFPDPRARRSRPAPPGAHESLAVNRRQ